MANLRNLFAGALLFVVSSAMIYGTWNPVMNFLSYFPTEIYVFAGVSWVLLVFTAGFYMPLMHLIADDRGE